MSSPASVKNHPLHPVLVAFPIGLLIFSLVCDLIGLSKPDNTAWGTVALYSMVGGIIGALVAAIPGLIDLLALKDPAVKKIGVRHMVINLIVVALFAIDAWLRFRGTTSGLPLTISIVGVILLLVSGWLGGEMVYVHGVAVEPQSDDAARAYAKDRIGAGSASRT
ncbi:MAG: hypothetical protein DLM53_11660 [Candidatus Eremiobacter antarcticus]|nr:DUF2231 domain-containing protein [Candidatus Eremiobacteraeota bacterium]MBC5809006.1 DUF2231 domain-containing protein [Candidatus Eremiobacteraeota bacterium]PZR60319.1 MAG: hypothetical protein DLM53_11660 [Candidatus Eremiobacter sp. RRmetagenome_bin22]